MASEARLSGREAEMSAPTPCRSLPSGTRQAMSQKGGFRPFGDIAMQWQECAGQGSRNPRPAQGPVITHHARGGFNPIAALRAAPNRRILSTNIK